MILYGLVQGCSLLLQRLPLPVCYFIADWVADVTFLVWRTGRANIIDNMSHVLGGGDTATAVMLARKALRNYLRYLVDFLRSYAITQAEVLERVDFNQWEPFDQALAGGKGALLVGLHMGNWDLGAALLAAKGYNPNVVADTFSNQRLNRFVEQVRHGLGLKTIPREQAARRVLQALRKNECLGILMDRPLPADSGVNVTFFGYPTAVPAGAATLALRTGAMVVPSGMIRVNGDHFAGLVNQCIAFQPTGNQAADVQALTQLIMDRLAEWVRLYPDQWYMFRRMWPKPLSTSTAAP